MTYVPIVDSRMYEEVKMDGLLVVLAVSHQMYSKAERC